MKNTINNHLWDNFMIKINFLKRKIIVWYYKRKEPYRTKRLVRLAFVISRDISKLLDKIEYHNIMINPENKPIGIFNQFNINK